jgi:hypothetical protein
MSSHRILYVVADLAPLRFLGNALQDCLIVRCPDDNQARLFLKSAINYSLLIFDEGLAGAELEDFARSLEHRKGTPAQVIKKPYDLGGLIDTIRRRLNG